MLPAGAVGHRVKPSERPIADAFRLTNSSIDNDPTVRPGLKPAGGLIAAMLLVIVGFAALGGHRMTPAPSTTAPAPGAPGPPRHAGLRPALDARGVPQPRERSALAVGRAVRLRVRQAVRRLVERLLSKLATPEGSGG